MRDESDSSDDGGSGGDDADDGSSLDYSGGGSASPAHPVREWATWTASWKELRPHLLKNEGWKWTVAPKKHSLRTTYVFVRPGVKMSQAVYGEDLWYDAETRLVYVLYCAVAAAPATATTTDP